MKECIVLAILSASLLAGSPPTIQDDKTLQACKSGLTYLIGGQYPGGEWKVESPINAADNATDAVTCIAALAVRTHLNLEIKSRKNPKGSLKNVTDFFLKTFKPDGRDDMSGNNVICFTNTFALLTLTRFWKDNKDDWLKEKIQGLIDKLVASQFKDGGWGYFPVRFAKSARFSFVTGAVLISLVEASHSGFKVPKESLASGVEFLKSQRNNNGAYRYHSTKHEKEEEESLMGSAGRNPICELALYLLNETDQEKLQAALDNFFSHRSEMEEARKDPECEHVRKLDGLASYYFFFDYFYALQALHFVDKNAKFGDSDSIAKCVEHTHKALLKIQNADGSWMDSKKHGGPLYGTAMALLILSGEKFLTGPLKK